MDKILHPVGPEPVAVYWRRRAAVLAGLVIVIVLLVMIVKAIAGAGGSAGPGAGTPTPTIAMVTAPPTTPAGPQACVADQLRGAGLATGADIYLEKASGGPDYQTDEPVPLQAKVKNTSSTDCVIVNNAHNVVLHVVSGVDTNLLRIFDSADCAAKVPTDSGETITLKAGEITVIPISWMPSLSQQGCPDTSERPKTGTYRATVSIIGVASDETRISLVASGAAT
ncbi:MAG: hypothetical protein LBD97_10015 [Bifidobacteriaceae bacterium]|nr:hypothetical protein [Bifidobacteriaceae bacterium]